MIPYIAPQEAYLGSLIFHCWLLLLPFQSYLKNKVEVKKKWIHIQTRHFWLQKRWPLFLSALNHPVPQKLVVEKNGIGEPVLKIDMTIDYNPLVFDKDSAVNRIENWDTVRFLSRDKHVVRVFFFQGIDFWSQMNLLIGFKNGAIHINFWK